jgi:hypothetical protein
MAPNHKLQRQVAREPFKCQQHCEQVKPDDLPYQYVGNQYVGNWESKKRH